MTGDFESAFRKLLKAVILEAATELLKERGFPYGAQPQSQQPRPSEDSLLLRSRDAAKRLAISERHLNTLTRSGVLPCVRLGQSVRYSVETIQRWIRESESGARSAPPGTAATRANESAARVATSSSKAISRTAQKRARANAEGPPEVREPTPSANARRLKELDESKQQERPNPVDLLLREIGVNRSELPSLTNGDLRRAAEVDVATLHGWLYLNRELPEAALEKLRCHFRDLRRDECSPDS